MRLSIRSLENSEQNLNNVNPHADSPLPHEPDATAKKDEHEGAFDSDGRFSLVMRDHTSDASSDDGSSRLILRLDVGEENVTRPYLSLVMMVERTFRALGLSPFGSGKKRLLFWFWIIFFVFRCVFLVVSLAQETAEFNASRARSPFRAPCNPRSTIISPNGFPNRDAQSIIIIFDYIGWIIIYFSGFGGSLHYFPRLCSHPEYIWLHSNFEKWLMLGMAFALFVVRLLIYMVPVLYSVGNASCPIGTVEDIVRDNRFNGNCSSAASLLLIAAAFDRRPVLGNSLRLLPFDVISIAIMIFVSIAAPLRFLSLANCATRALQKLMDSHFSPKRSSFDTELFFSDFSLVNAVTIRLQRLSAPSSQLGFQVVLIALFNVVLTVLCLIEIQLAFVLDCFKLPELDFPDSFLYVKMCFNALRIVSATFALGCCLVPVCYFNHSIENLSIQISSLLQSENNQVLVHDIAFDWLNPKLVMTNMWSVHPSILQRRSKIMSSLTESQRQRLSHMLISLNCGDHSFSLAGITVLRFRHIVTFYSLLGSVYFFTYQANLRI